MKTCPRSSGFTSDLDDLLLSFSTANSLQISLFMTKCHAKIDVYNEIFVMTMLNIKNILIKCLVFDENVVSLQRQIMACVNQ